MILFGFIMLFYVSIRTSSLRANAGDLRHEEAQALVRKLASTPEFAWSVEDCASCIDMDKVFALKNKSRAYEEFWGPHTRMLRIQEIYPAVEERECTAATYPDCTTLTLVNKGSGYTSDEAFVALCHMKGQPAYTECRLGILILGVAST